MKTFSEKKFNIPTLKGISEKTITEHLKLYSGYVKHANLITEEIDKISKETSTNPNPNSTYIIGELQRRFGFEFNGIINHEYYFESFEGGHKSLLSDSKLFKAIEEEWGSFDSWLSRFKTLALTRGIGWAMLYFDTKNKRLLNAWIDEQHLGQLNSCKTILALDMWEHSFVSDYQPSGKKNYIEDFFANLNWENIEKNFVQL